MIYDHVFLKPKNLGWLLCITGSWFWNSDRIVQSNSVNCEPFFFAVLLALRTSLCKKNIDPCEPRLNRMVLKTVNSSHGSFLFSKYRLKLKIWPACTLDFFQIWNQRFMREQKNKLGRRRWQNGGCAKLKQQASNPTQIASHKLTAFIFIFYFYLFFFLLFLLLLFLLSVSTIVVSHLLSVWVCFEFFFMFAKPIHVTCIGKEEDFWLLN